jgi:uncharacterized protein (TIGR00369 family)
MGRSIAAEIASEWIGAAVVKQEQLENRVPRDWKYGTPPREELASRSGLDFLLAIASGELPAPTIAEHLLFEPLELERGRAVFIGWPSELHMNPLGTVHGGYTATLLDSCMGCAVQTLLDAGEGFTTLELKVNFIRPLLPGMGKVLAAGTAIHRGSRTAVAEARLEDQAGRLLAHGTSTCLLLELSQFAREGTSQAASIND